VGLFWALAIALARIDLRARHVRRWRTALLVCALATTGRSSVHTIRFHAPDAHREWLREQLLPALNPTLSFAANDSLVPHLATRRWVSPLPQFTQASGESVDCVIFDSTINAWPLSPEAAENAVAELRDWQLVYDCGATRVWQSPRLAPGSTGDARCLRIDVNKCVILQE
jgi:hypothetical protein